MSDDKWIIIDGKGQRVNPKLMTESQADAEIDVLTKKALTEAVEGTAPQVFTKKRYLVG